MTPDEIRETVAVLKRREQIQFEKGLCIGIFVGLILAGLIGAALWGTS